MASEFKDTHKDYLAGFARPSDMEERGFVRTHILRFRYWAIQSGSLVPDEFSEISRSIEQCVEDARVFYTMSFDPPYAAQPDEYHDLKVQIENDIVYTDYHKFGAEARMLLGIRRCTGT
jgi:hypothetical protein